MNGFNRGWYGFHRPKIIVDLAYKVPLVDWAQLRLEEAIETTGGLPWFVSERG